MDKTLILGIVSSVVAISAAVISVWGQLRVKRVEAQLELQRAEAGRQRAGVGRPGRPITRLAEGDTGEDAAGFDVLANQDVEIAAARGTAGLEVQEAFGGRRSPSWLLGFLARPQ